MYTLKCFAGHFGCKWIKLFVHIKMFLGSFRLCHCNFGFYLFRQSLKERNRNFAGSPTRPNTTSTASHSLKVSPYLQLTYLLVGWLFGWLIGVFQNRVKPQKPGNTSDRQQARGNRDQHILLLYSPPTILENIFGIVQLVLKAFSCHLNFFVTWKKKVFPRRSCTVRFT